ncbi:MAG: glycerophosphodiester phosphodiesterase [Gammaproteobacteria bacterium]|nr:glycerophosphodiester phosphodiesterase [Gammaproteobacteria bacterium]
MCLTAWAGNGSGGRDHQQDNERHGHHGDHGRHLGKNDPEVQLGPRPFFLLGSLEEGDLKDKLLQCQSGPFYQTDFSIGHRGGGTLQFPEHTAESHEAGARMGAGIMECDVTFTSDGELVCRHSECDLHTTTNIVDTPLNNKCSVPWAGAGSQPRCCTSDLTVDEFKSLQGKMDASNPAAATAAGYLGGTADWRTDLYNSRGMLLTHKESIDLIKSLGGRFTPELKGGNPQRIAAIFGSQEAYAQKMIDEYKEAGIPPEDVWAQSFNKDDVLYWIAHEPAFGQQAVFLDDIDPTDGNPDNDLPPTLDELRDLKSAGVQVIAPPMWALLTVNNRGEIVPSQYAMDARTAGLDIITWTFERSDLRKGAAGGGWYYRFDPNGVAVKTDGDMYKALDVLAKDVGILGIFSDWSATVTYYANCMDL